MADHVEGLSPRERGSLRAATFRDEQRSADRFMNALAALHVIETRGGAVTLSRGGKSYRDQRVLV